MRDENLLTKPDEPLQTLMEAMSEGVWDRDIRTNSVKFSDAWCRSLGFEPFEVKPHFSFYESLIHPEDWPEVQRQMAAPLTRTSPRFRM